MTAKNLLSRTEAGLFCEAGGFHIDPSRAVARAVITHAHGDHARSGSRQYYCAEPGAGLLRERLTQEARIESVAYGKSIELGSARISFHSAGHILGSAQIRIEVDGQVWVVSGDYKRDADPSCAPFEVVPCDVFVTEATFGLPLYRWGEGCEVAREIVQWWRENARHGFNTLVYCYALGKAQRLLAEFAPLLEAGEVVWVHETIEALNRSYRAQGVRLAPCALLSAAPSRIAGALILAPPGTQGTPGIGGSEELRTAFASGWVRARRARFSRRYDRSFVLSDHADWPQLVRTVRDTGAKRVYVMHGSDEVLARYLRETFEMDARPLSELPC